MKKKKKTIQDPTVTLDQFLRDLQSKKYSDRQTNFKMPGGNNNINGTNRKTKLLQRKKKNYENLST